MADRQLPDLTRPDRTEPKVTRQGEGSHAHRLVGGEVHDARGLLAKAFPAGPLLRRELLVEAGKPGRVGQEVLLTTRDIERPQTRDRVIPVL
jgi:hypothetical protein